MIKKLRIKFVCVVMLVVALIHMSIFATIYHFFFSGMEGMTEYVMRTFAENPFFFDTQMMQGEEELPEDFQYLFSTVRLSPDGTILETGGSLYGCPEETLRAILAEVTAAESPIGELDAYNLRYSVAQSETETHILLCDMRFEQGSQRAFLRMSSRIWLFALAVFLVLAILLSHWVIKPVETAWTQQRQFVADASHELKTPLSVIMANAELLQSEGYTREERDGFAANILTVSYQMRSLVDNMLEMARADNGSAKMTFAPLDFSQLVRDAVLSVQLLYEERGKELRTAIESGIRVLGSEANLYQLMDVLLDNALKYSDREGAVTVTLEKRGKHCLLTVSDPGTPIPKEDLKNIFKRFYRGDKARAMNGSYGLGLSIAESVAAAHKGKIWAQSADGQNLFRVQLPTV